MGARRRKVAIVGGGASGLIALVEALEAGMDAELYEARSEVGGAWILSKDAGDCHKRCAEDGSIRLEAPGDTDPRAPPPPTPMYPCLRTNVPTSLMEYRGRPFGPDVHLFPGPEPIVRYLQSVAEGLSRNIHLSTRVTRLRYTHPDEDTNNSRWAVELQAVSTSNQEESPRNGSTSRTEYFDNVFVANGHYSKTYVPRIEGLQSFRGDIRHTRWFRTAEDFLDKTVLVVGNGASGYDATREIADSIHRRRQQDPHARLPRIYQSARSPSALGIPFDDPSAPDWAKEIEVFPQISRIDSQRIDFADGRSVGDVDVILFATGYLFDFPFCSFNDSPWKQHPLTKAPEAKSTVTQEPGIRVHHLDQRDLFYWPDPSVAFLCLPYMVLPFSLAQIQARLAVKSWTHEIDLEIKPGTGEDVEETRSALVYGHPKQFDSHDNWLKEMGEGGDHGTWARTSEATRDLRVGAKALRRAVLGY